MRRTAKTYTQDINCSRHNHVAENDNEAAYACLDIATAAVKSRTKNQKAGQG